MTDIFTTEGLLRIVDALKDTITPIGIELYKIYLKQTIATGIINLIYCIGAIIGFPLLLNWINKRRMKISNGDISGDEEAWNFAYEIGIVITVIAIIIAFITIPSAIMHIINPDYYIVQNLLNGVSAVL